MGLMSNALVIMLRWRRLPFVLDDLEGDVSVATEQ
jgi:hypothetical protein